MSEVPAHEHTPRGEWRKFITLVIILFGVILVVALLRPLIFNRIVPAILGENIPQSVDEVSPPADEVDEPTGSEGSVDHESSEDAEAVDDSEEMADEPASDAEVSDEEDASNEQPGGDDAESSEDAEDDPEEETAVDNTEQETHTVEFGQNLVQIARRYGVTVDELIEANDIANPDIVRIGDVLVIPSK